MFLPAVRTDTEVSKQPWLPMQSLWEERPERLLPCLASLSGSWHMSLASRRGLLLLMQPGCLNIFGGTLFGGYPGPFLWPFYNISIPMLRLSPHASVSSGAARRPLPGYPGLRTAFIPDLQSGSYLTASTSSRILLSQPKTPGTCSQLWCRGSAWASLTPESPRTAAPHLGQELMRQGGSQAANKVRPQACS